MDLLWLWDIRNISARRMARVRQSKSCLSSLCVGNWEPHTSFPNSLILLYLASIWMGESKKTHLQCMLDNFKRGYTGDYRLELTPQNLWKFCQIDWVSFKVGWPSEWYLDWETICRSYQFPYIDIWQSLAAHPGLKVALRTIVRFWWLKQWQQRLLKE
jgi:hypothetical protein